MPKKSWTDWKLPILTEFEYTKGNVCELDFFADIVELVALKLASEGPTHIHKYVI